MAVRSRPFWIGPALTPAATFVTQYTVPTDRTARFSLVSVSNGGGAAALVYIIAGPSGSEQFVFVENVPANTTRLVLQGMILTEGQKVKAYCGTNNVVTVAGFGSLLMGDPA